MARHRNWDPLIWAEVFVRICDLKQTPYRVAKATGLTYMQVSHFVSQITDTHLPTNIRLPSKEQIEQVRTVVTAASEAEDATAAAPREARLAAQTARQARIAARPAPIDTVALNEEIEGCIDLVKQAAAQFGISPRSFLGRCIAHARSAV